MTKLPHYVLPLYPAIAILIARSHRRARRCRDKPWLTRWHRCGWFLVPVIAGIARPSLRSGHRAAVRLLAWPFGAAAVILGFWPGGSTTSTARSARCCARRRPRSMLISFAVFGVVHPARCAGVSERDARRHHARRGCRKPRRGGGRLSRAEPGLSRRHAHAPDRRRRRRRIPARRRLPLRLHRGAPGTRFRAARRADRAALSPARPRSKRFNINGGRPITSRSTARRRRHERRRRCGATRADRSWPAPHRRQRRCSWSALVRPAAAVRGAPAAGRRVAASRSARIAAPLLVASRWCCSTRAAIALAARAAAAGSSTRSTRSPISASPAGSSFRSASLLIVLAALAHACGRGASRSLVLASLIVRLGFLFLAIALPGLFVTIVKRLIGRARPVRRQHAIRSPMCRASGSPQYASMPSGHATTAFAAAVAIGALWPRRASDVDLRAADRGRAAS